MSKNRAFRLPNNCLVAHFSCYFTCCTNMCTFVVCGNLWLCKDVYRVWTKSHRTAGSWFVKRRWLASSSNPHWQMTRFAPASLHFITISSNFSCSNFWRDWYSSTEVTLTSCFVLGLGGSKGQVRIATLASLTTWNRVFVNFYLWLK